jgi:hypothetical protein
MGITSAEWSKFSMANIAAPFDDIEPSNRGDQ